MDRGCESSEVLPRLSGSLVKIPARAGQRDWSGAQKGLKEEVTLMPSLGGAKSDERGRGKVPCGGSQGESGESEARSCVLRTAGKAARQD